MKLLVCCVGWDCKLSSLPTVVRETNVFDNIKSISEKTGIVALYQGVKRLSSLR